MRLDKFLKVSRIVKRRTVANEICDAKHALVNGQVARAGASVRRYEVLEVTEYATKESAERMYKTLS